MKGTLKFAALSLMMSCHVHAQSSVTIYGDLDEGLQYLTHAGPGNHAVFGLQSGNASPSRIGLSGKEDLGGGYAALFKLETGIDMSTGAYIIPGEAFDRYAYVGVQSPYGTLTLGRQRSILFEQSIFFDPTYLAQFSTMSTGYIPVQSINQNNSLRYTTPEIGGIKGIVMGSFGQQLPGTPTAGRFLSGALTFEHESFAARAVYEQSRGLLSTAPPVDASSKVDQRVSLAARYALGAATVYGGYTNISGDLHYSPPGSLIYGAGSYNFGPAFNVLLEVSHYRTSDQEGQPTWFIAGATYALSKRTSLYAFGGYLRTSSGKKFTLNTYDFSSAGGFNQTGFQIGMNHAF